MRVDIRKQIVIVCCLLGLGCGAPELELGTYTDSHGEVIILCKDGVLIHRFGSPAKERLGRYETYDGGADGSRVILSDFAPSDQAMHLNNSMNVIYRGNQMYIPYGEEDENLHVFTRSSEAVSPP